MFSMPAPLPKPIGELSAVANFNSDTATLPYPTQLAITTPPAARSRGDWGLKRPLPLKSTTKSSTPVIRVDAIDTFEHVTQFESAADHTLTLQKWQEMNMPLFTPASTDSALLGLGAGVRPGRGVFEEDADITAADESTKASHENRWRFRGPWLAGQTEADFVEFLTKEVRKRGSEFRQFLREYKAAEDTKTARRMAAAKGEEVPAAIKPSDITESQMTEYLKVLRHERSALFGLIREFLDLPPAPANSLDENALFNSLGSAALGSEPMTINYADHLPKSRSPYANTGPPSTHPSAGLSYLRSKSHIYNHPMYGPQASPPPVQGRVVQPKNALVGNFAPKLGVAGVVTHVPTYQDSFNTNTINKRLARAGSQTLPGLVNIELDRVGGAKVWLQPTSASIDPKGRIQLTVSGAQNAAVAVHEGTVDALPAELQRPASPAQPIPRPSRPLFAPSGPAVFGDRAGPAGEIQSGKTDWKWKSSDDEALEALQKALLLSQAEQPSKT